MVLGAAKSDNQKASVRPPARIIAAFGRSPHGQNGCAPPEPARPEIFLVSDPGWTKLAAADSFGHESPPARPPERARPAARALAPRGRAGLPRARAGSPQISRSGRLTGAEGCQNGAGSGEIRQPEGLRPSKMALRTVFARFERSLKK